MEKYLFSDGTNPVKELQSRQELEACIGATQDKGRIRIWFFHTSEWISYADYRKRSPAAATATVVPVSPREKTRTRSSPGRQWLKKSLYLALFASTAVLVLNFTRISWENQENMILNASRPANVPLMDMDSLVSEIEMQRGQKLDRSTRTNFRLRNTWPDRILLQLRSARESSRSNGSRFSHIVISIDNTTGFRVDHAVVRFISWKNQQVSHTDTLHFNSIGYEQPIQRELDGSFRGDSLSVSFESIRAKAFNFCYSSTTRNPGNYNDRWFCREEEKEVVRR